MTTALEQSFADLCEKHEVHYISASINMEQPARARFLVSIQWPGDGNCAMQHGHTLSEALTRAIAEVYAMRTPAPPSYFADAPLAIASGSTVAEALA